MNNFESERQESLERRSWQERRHVIGASSNSLANCYGKSSNNNTQMTKYGNFIDSNKFQGFPRLEDDNLVSSVVPAVTVVPEDRSIYHRINLHNHSSYQNFAKALRQMFVDSSADTGGGVDDLHMSNAIPGHLIAYEDMENDLPSWRP